MLFEGLLNAAQTKRTLLLREIRHQRFVSAPMRPASGADDRSSEFRRLRSPKPQCRITRRIAEAELVVPVLLPTRAH